MNLLTKADEGRLHNNWLSENDQANDPYAMVKFFTPDANWTWYAFSFDGVDTFYGLVDGLELELGYFSLKELQGVRGNLGLPVERDRYFKPILLSELRAKLGDK